MTYQTEQESFWAGKFGDEYIDRNTATSLMSANFALFSKILGRTSCIRSAIEFGANIGLNLRAIRQLLPKAALSAVEINHRATQILRDLNLGGGGVHEGSLLDYEPKQTYDLAFTKGVLIHIDPAQLPHVYDLLFTSSSRYILIAEYYNPTPVELPYRNHKGKLFKRDFAGELMDKFSSLTLLDYGFSYHRDAQFPQDDLTWFLLEKKG